MLKYGNFSISAKYEPYGNKGKITISGDIVDFKWYDDEVAPTDVMTELDSMPDTISELEININSYGGSVWAGQFIANLLEDKKRKAGCKAVTKIYGIAASMASAIAMVGDKIIMPLNAAMMIHKPSTVAIGNEDDMQKAINMLQVAEAGLVTLYMRHFKGTEDELEALLAEEKWMTAQQCLDYGFCTEIETPVQVAACAKGVDINGLVLSYDAYAPLAGILNTKEKEKEKGGEDKTMNEELQKNIMDILNDGSKCVLTMNEGGEISIDTTATTKTAQAESVENSATVDALTSSIATLNAKIAEQSVKAAEYDNLRKVCIENALAVGAGAGEAKALKLGITADFNSERWGKILNQFTLEEIQAQSDSWRDEKAALLGAGVRLSVPTNNENNIGTSAPAEAYKISQKGK